MGKLKYNEEDFAKSANTFEKELLAIPVITLREASKNITIKRGVRGTVYIGTKKTSGGKIAPYKANRRTDVDLNLNYRPLTTYFGSVNDDFDPNEAMGTILDHQASKAMDGELVSTPTAREVLALEAKDATEDMPYALWSGIRNPKGDTTFDLFDGFDTITERDIETGEVSEENGNLIILDQEITAENAYDIITGIVEKLNPLLRRQKCYLYCSQAIADAYNRSYKKEGKGISYNNKYEQNVVEGSNGNLVISVEPGKDGSRFMHISPKLNMYFGCDQESDDESVRVKEYEPDTLTFMMRLFAGAQMRSVHKSQLCVVKLASKKEDKPVIEDPEDGPIVEDPEDDQE